MVATLKTGTYVVAATPGTGLKITTPASGIYTVALLKAGQISTPLLFHESASVSTTPDIRGKYTGTITATIPIHKDNS